VVSNGHWLTTLQVCVAWKDCFSITACLIEKRILKPTNKIKEVINSVPRIEASVGGNLIIPRTRGMKLSASRSDPFGESCFDIHVDVLVFNREFEVTFCDFILNLVKPIFDLGEFTLGQDPSFDQGSGMGD
jgi:hypothetical protein